MNPAWLYGNSVGALTIPWLTARETAALIVVVVSLLFFRSFRERYLLAWGMGWIAYGVFLWSARASDLPGASRSMAAFCQADFVLAVGLFAAAALMSSQARRTLTALAVVTGVVIGYAALRPLYFGDSSALGIGLEVACRLIAIWAALELMRYRLGRMGVGPLLFSAGLLTLNLNWPPFTNHVPNEGYLLAEVLFGASMIVLVLDDSRVRTRRLEVLNELTGTISRAQNHGPMMQAALEKLKAVTRAKAAWFSLMEEGHLTPTQHLGLSADFLRTIGLAGMDETVTRALEENRVAVLRPSEVPEELQAQLREQRMGHLLLVPVQGKKSVIGMLSLGCSGSPRHSQEELEFLETAAQRLGIAVENLRLLEQVLRSQRQWMNTFDSIQDLILAHDADFHILKTNQALLQRLGRAPADVLGSLCDAVLPHQQVWAGCPYCERGPGMSEGQVVRVVAALRAVIGR